MTRARDAFLITCLRFVLVWGARRILITRLCFVTAMVRAGYDVTVSSLIVTSNPRSRIMS
ncbi:hypothetical protein EC9_24010 [Rosistilla ulvae]|uniref:Uncharacterized protein n=1 Tax=Rosistilla ulvae TaxID=1930277 RepID=A0A517M017_9BACT|nr:hypothetical protein EC9_24010 [Rosistilla ulvae]